MEFSQKVACGEFVKRQTPESGYSHFVDNNWEALASLTSFVMTTQPEKIIPGYRDGVVLVELPPHWFMSAIVKLEEDTKLTASYAPRRKGEDPFLRVSAKAKKQPAQYAQVVLYRWDVLAENNERETWAEWEIVCIKARVTEEEEPMDPYTMARNFLHLAGGTKGDFTAEQFAKSIVYWNNHCMTTGKPKWYKKAMEWLRQLRRDVVAAGLQYWESLPFRKD